MDIVYSGEPVPEVLTKGIFLAGPSPREQSVMSWRPDALKIFEALGYDGTVFVPETRDGKPIKSYIGQLEWEEMCLRTADCILFWVPRELNTMPAFTTNVEWGVWQDSGKAVFGAPKEAPKNSYLFHYSHKLGVPTFHTLEETVKSAIQMVGNGSTRLGGERDIPLYIWNTPHFQSWYKALKNAGNRLDGAKVLWTFRTGPDKKFTFFWALHVNVYVSHEKRNKTNEVVIARPDIATILMYKRASTIEETEVVLISEFRSPVSNTNGMVVEIPGGSTFKPTQDPLVLAANECKEETGLSIDVQRVVRHESRQLVAPLSSHKAHLFSIELRDDELQSLKNLDGLNFGVNEDSERTYVQVVKVKDILNSNSIDWSMLGMILSVLAQV